MITIHDPRRLARRRKLSSKPTMEPGSQLRKALHRLGHGLALACLAAPASCKATENFAEPERHMLSSASPLPVTLSSELRGLRKRSTENGDRTVYKIGHLLRRLFSGKDGHAFLNLVGSEIEISGGPTSLWRSRYQLAVALQLGGEYHLIQVHGSGESATGPREAGKLAVEDCVEQVYQRLFSLVGPSFSGNSS